MNSTPLVPYPHRFSPLSQFDNGYSEGRYNEVLQRLVDIYTPIITDEGGSFHILSDWTDGAVNMWAWRIGDEYWLEIPGGMSRYHLINEEAFITSICHELGHLLGGEPKNHDISFEGQADYYTNQGCNQRMLQGFDAEKELEGDPEVERACQNSTALCQRLLKGSKSLTSYYAELENRPPPKLETPSPEQVSETISQHPPAQCRLDTMLASFFSTPRPGCWFKN